MEKNIVILGAGYAGILTAKKLAKKLRKQEDVKITVIDVIVEWFSGQL